MMSYVNYTISDKSNLLSFLSPTTAL